jgi:hypothetical protein
MSDELAAAQLAHILDEWIVSVADPELARCLRAEAYIAGGAIASLLSEEPVQDYDVYVRQAATAQALQAYYAAFFRRHPAPAHDPQQPFALATEPTVPCRPLTMTTHAVYLSTRIQLMTSFYGEPAWMVSLYDYEHCTGYYTASERQLVVSAAARQAITTRTLRYRPGAYFPLLSLLRLPKFIARGYTIELGQLFQLALTVAGEGLGERGWLRQLLGLLGEKDSRFLEALAVAEALPDGPLDQAALAAVLQAVLAPAQAPPHRLAALSAARGY